MNAESELLHTYREWRRLAQAETKAIQTRNWDLLTDCHVAIRDYQAAVVGLTQTVRAEWQRTGCNLADKEHNLRVQVSDLITLTRHNQTLLQTTLTAARQQLGRLGEVGHNLQRLRRSYGYVPSAGRVLA